MSTTYSYEQQAQEDAQCISIHSPTSTVEKGDNVRVRIQGNPDDTDIDIDIDMKNDKQEAKLFENALSLEKGPFKYMEQKMPRTYNICMYIIIPLLFLIGLSFLFGLGLATLEGPGEIESNNQLLRDFISENHRVSELVSSVDEKYKSCLVEYTTLGGGGGGDNNHDLLTFMEDCTNDKRIEISNHLDKTYEDTFMNLAINNQFSYNWVTCGFNETSGRSYAHEQSFTVHENWWKSFTSYKNIYIGQGLTESNAMEKAFLKADGSETCVINYTGGAIFWFTIMTTIGYGNTAPVTMGGRALVVVMGFVSILLFSAVMGHAGYIMVTIVDDFFTQFGMKRFLEGIISVLFWSVMLLLWLFAYAGLAYAYTYEHWGQFDIDYRFVDAFWFAYISVTTIGFGDLYIRHDVAKPIDMLVTPLFFLAGFVILANFLVKFSEMVINSVILSSKELDVNMKSIRRTVMVETSMRSEEEKNDFLSSMIVDECSAAPSFEVPHQNMRLITSNAPYSSRKHVNLEIGSRDA
jgi:hypothetical protein